MCLNDSRNEAACGLCNPLRVARWWAKVKEWFAPEMDRFEFRQISPRGGGGWALHFVNRAGDRRCIIVTGAKCVIAYNDGKPSLEIINVTAPVRLAFNLTVGMPMDEVTNLIDRILVRWGLEVVE